MSYAQAIEAQAALRAYWTGEFGVESLAEQFQEDLSNGTIDPATTIEDYVRNTVSTLVYGEPYYWSPEICGVIRSVAAEAPPWTLTEDQIPGRAGFFHFATPFVFPCTDCAGVELPVVGWRKIFVESLGKPALGITYFHRHADQPLAVPDAVMPWVCGESWDEILKAPPDADRRSEPISQHFWAVVQVFASCLAFLQQRVVVTRAERAPRPTRKRLEREGWTHEPIIQVVQLRRSAHQDHQSERAEAPVEWSCQWIVRGHWRLQPCGPNFSERRPVFVLPYVKGDPDKPLKASAERVFAVVR